MSRAPHRLEPSLGSTKTARRAPRSAGSTAASRLSAQPPASQAPASQPPLGEPAAPGSRLARQPGTRGPGSHERREQILQAATQLFSHFGYQRATIADIARTIGLSTAYIYKFFDSKQALGQAICASRMGTILEEVRLVAERPDPAARRMRAIYRTIAEQGARLFFNDRRLHDLAVIATSENWPTIRNYQADLHTLVQDLIVAGREAREFERKTSLAETSSAVLQTMELFSPADVPGETFRRSGGTSESDGRSCSSQPGCLKTISIRQVPPRRRRFPRIQVRTPGAADKRQRGARQELAMPRKIWSGRRDSNPRPQPWQGCALPLSYARAPNGDGVSTPARVRLARPPTGSPCQENREGTRFRVAGPASGPPGWWNEREPRRLARSAPRAPLTGVRHETYTIRPAGFRGRAPWI